MDYSRIVLNIILGKRITSSQKADIESTSGGSYMPIDSEEFFLELFKLDLENNIPELIKLYKKLPAQTVQSDALAVYLGLEPTKPLSTVKLSSPTTLVNTPLEDRDWRMDNLYKIINKKHKKVTFTRNTAQLYLDNIDHPRIVALKARQRGISTFALIDALDECMIQPDKIKGLQADNLLSANSLMEKAKLAYRSLPPECLPKIVYSNNSEISFDNGSKLRISTSFRGQTLSSLHVSELGKISLNREKAVELTTGTFPAIPMNRESRITLESTSEGAGNLFYDIFTEAEQNYNPKDISTFYPLFIGWIGIIENGKLVPNTADPDCWLEVPDDDETVVPAPLDKFLHKAQRDTGYEFSEEQIMWACAAYRTLGNDIAEMAKEYPCTVADCWASSSEGLILAESFNQAKIDTSLTWNERYPRYAASDLGVSDTATIVFFQYYDNRMHIVADYQNSSQDIAHYTNLVIKEDIAIWFLPHDANNRNVSTAKKVITHIRLAGYTKYKVLKQTASVWTDLSRVRSLMPHVIFGNVPDLTSSIKAYRKVWSNQTGTYLDKPLHDEASHFCDGFRYACLAVLDHITK